MPNASSCQRNVKALLLWKPSDTRQASSDIKIFKRHNCLMWTQIYVFLTSYKKHSEVFSLEIT